MCSIADPWRNEIPSVARITISGAYLCTGFMVNNTARDRKPLFMTASRCNLNSSNAATLVAYWNHETSIGAGEDCLSCPADRNAVQGGKKPSTRHCCGDSACAGAETRANCSLDCGACLPAGSSCTLGDDCCSRNCRSRVCR